MQSEQVSAFAVEKMEMAISRFVHIMPVLHCLCQAHKLSEFSE